MSANYLLVFCVSLLVLVPTSCLTDNVALFMFGDSIFDAGNNNYIKHAFTRANFWPYGETFFKYPTGRFSDGRLVPDFIAEYLKLPLLPPFLKPGHHQFIEGVNFASAGAGALVETRPPGSVIDLNTQLTYFKDVQKLLVQQSGEAECKKLLSKAIYLFSIGNNDYVAPFSTNASLIQPYTNKEYVGMVIGNITNVIKKITKSGGKKFGILGVMPLGCLPIFRAQDGAGGGCMGEINLLAKLHNKALLKVLNELQSQVEGFRYSYFDTYTSLRERISHPSKYGFKEGKTACCGSGPYRGLLTCGSEEYQLCEHPSDYVFFDGIHPTQKINSQFSELLWDGNPDAVSPCSLKKFV